MTDKFEGERFDGTCPTCGQKFLVETTQKLYEALGALMIDLHSNNEGEHYIGPLADIPEGRIEFAREALKQARESGLFGARQVV